MFQHEPRFQTILILFLKFLFSILLPFGPTFPNLKKPIKVAGVALPHVVGWHVPSHEIKIYIVKQDMHKPSAVPWLVHN